MSHADTDRASLAANSDVRVLRDQVQRLNCDPSQLSGDSCSTSHMDRPVPDGAVSNRVNGGDAKSSKVRFDLEVRK